jgi:hypothetical protein
MSISGPISGMSRDDAGEMKGFVFSPDCSPSADSTWLNLPPESETPETVEAAATDATISALTARAAVAPRSSLSQRIENAGDAAVEW